MEGETILSVNIKQIRLITTISINVAVVETNGNYSFKYSTEKSYKFIRMVSLQFGWFWFFSQRHVRIKPLVFTSKKIPKNPSPVKPLWSIRAFTNAKYSIPILISIYSLPVESEKFQAIFCLHFIPFNSEFILNIFFWTIKIQSGLRVKYGELSDGHSKTFFHFLKICGSN